MLFVALDWRSALSMGAYFVIEGVFVVAETRLDLRTWPVSLARAWTYLVILGPMPFCIDPFLRVFGL